MIVITNEISSLIHGVNDDVNEDTDGIAIKLIQDDLEVDVNIDGTHRFGSSKNSNRKTRPIKVTFTRYIVMCMLSVHS